MPDARLLDSLTPAEIKTAVLAEMGERGSAESYDLLDAVAKRCGSHRLNYGTDRPYEVRRIVDRYVARIGRAMAALADDDLLVRGGRGYKNIVTYHTPADWAAREARAEAAEAERTAENERWTQVMARLGDQEILMTTAGQLSLESWERLLGRAGW